MGSNLFDNKHKLYFGNTEIPLVIRDVDWFWDKFDFDIQRFDIVEEDDE